MYMYKPHLHHSIEDEQGDNNDSKRGCGHNDHDDGTYNDKESEYKRPQCPWDDLIDNIGVL